MPRRDDDDRLPWLQAVALRLTTLLLEVVGRVADLLVLLRRPSLYGPYLGVWWAELRRTPYRWPRDFESIRVVKQSGQAIRELMYGEALLPSAVWLFRRAGVTSASRVLDVGAGRGRALLAARWLGAEAVGLELRQAHVRAAERAVQRAGARLVAADAQVADLGAPTHVFLNWCAFSPQTKQRLVDRFAALPQGTRFCAVSQPIDDPRFVTRSRHRVLFTWGTEPVWLQERV